MIKRIFYWVFTILQVLFLIAASGIQYFSVKRMGMMRYVVYINREWESQYPITLLQYAAIVFLVALSIAIILYAKKKQGSYFTVRKFFTIIIGIIITFTFIFFTLAYSTENYRSYYFTSIILAITALIQDIKTFIYLKG